MGLEGLVNETRKDFEERRLINGDTLKGVFVEESMPEKTFFATDQGDLWYVQDDEAFQASVDRRGELLKKSLPKDDTPFIARDQYDPSEALASLESISQRINKRPYLGDDRKRFHDQLVRLAGEVTPIPVDKELLEETLHAYVPTTRPVSPFGRYTDARELIKKEEDEGKRRVWNRPMHRRDAYVIAGVATLLAGKELERPTNRAYEPIWNNLNNESEENLQKIGGEILDEFCVSRNFSVEGSIPSFVKSYGFNQGERSDEQMYDVKRGKQHWQLFLHDERPLHIDLQQGPSTYHYERTVERKKKNIFAGLSRKMRNGWEKTKDHVRHRVVPYALSTALLANAGSFFLGSHYGQNQEKEPQEAVIVPEKNIQWEERPVTIEEKETYVVRPGDNLWNIAKEYADDTSNKAVFEWTNQIAQENNKLTIPAYHEKKDQGETISRQENPNLIYPGDSLTITQEREVMKKFPVEETIDALVTPVEEEEKQEHAIDNVLFMPPKQPQVQAPYLPETTRVDQVEQPTDYVGIVKDLVQMKNAGKSFGDMQTKYTGFSSEEDLKKAFADYQGFVQSSMIDNVPIDRYDNRIASNDFKNRLVHEYQRGNGSLKDIRQELKKEYGMDVSESTISKYARKALGVGSRQEARTI